jgi:hypothetical protein
MTFAAGVILGAVGAPPIDALAAAIAGHVRAVRETAAASPPGGGPAWDALLGHYRLAAFDSNERATVVRCLRLSRGATPGEVRMVLASLATWAAGEASRLASNPALAMEVAGLRAWIDGLVDRELGEYERSIGVAPAPAAPPAPASAAPSLGSIFANAQQTSKEVPWANMKFEQVATLTCVHCGGPQERPMDFMCKYCRRPIAGSILPTT